MAKADFLIATEMPSGARSRGYDLDELETAERWYELVSAQMKGFGIKDSAVLMFSGGVEIMRTNL